MAPRTKRPDSTEEALGMSEVPRSPLAEAAASRPTPSKDDIAAANRQFAAQSEALDHQLSMDTTLLDDVDPGYDPESGPTPEEIARIRKMRKPMGAFAQKLDLAKRPGYHRHWFNDLPGRIEQAKASGWAHVRDSLGRPVSRNVGRSGEHRGGQVAYAMEIPEVFWLEDMAARHKDAQDRMDAIKTSPFQAKPGEAKPEDAQKFYSPQDVALEIKGPR